MANNIISINQLAGNSGDLGTRESSVFYVNIDTLNNTDFTSIASGDLIVFIDGEWSDIESIVLSSTSSSNQGNFLLIDGEAYFSDSLTFSGLTLPSTDSTANYGIKTNGSGSLSLAEVSLSSGGASSLIPYIDSVTPSQPNTGVSTTIELSGQNFDEETRFYFFSGVPSASDLANLTNTVDSFLEDSVTAGLASSKSDPGYITDSGIVMTNHTYSSSRNPFVIFSSELVKFSVNSSTAQSISLVAKNSGDVYYVENAISFSAYTSITFDDLSGGDWSATGNNLYAGSGSVNNGNLIRSNETFSLSSSNYGYRYRWESSGTQPTNTGINYTTDTGESANWQNIRYQVSTNSTSNLNVRKFGSAYLQNLTFGLTAPSGKNVGDIIGFASGTVFQINVSKTSSNDTHGLATLQYVENPDGAEVIHDIYSWPEPIDLSKTIQTAHALDRSNTSILDNRVYQNSADDLDYNADNSTAASFPSQTSPYYVAGNSLGASSGSNLTSNLIVSNESFSLDTTTNPNGVKLIFTLDGRQPCSWGLRYTDDTTGSLNWQKARWWFVNHNSRIDLGSFGTVNNSNITWPSNPPTGFTQGNGIPYALGATYAIQITPDGNGTTGTVKLQYVYESGGSTQYFDIYTWSNSADLTKSIEGVFAFSQGPTGLRNIRFIGS
jgi:hypothetical protein